MMSEIADDKVKGRCVPFYDICSLSHIKSVIIGMVTEYESRTSYFYSNTLFYIYYVMS